jgi:hypothetical protein
MTEAHSEAPSCQIIVDSRAIPLQKHEIQTPGERKFSKYEIPRVSDFQQKIS